MKPVVDLLCEFRYEAAHQLTGVPADHQCARLHGHSYHLTAVISGSVDPETGFVADFAVIKNAIRPIVDELDHRTLNEIIENPTVENQLVWLWERIADHADISELRLRETATNSATYRGEQR
jgi:6-pyruvoyltetrahydropterin/6-carboxytetrahydropterin synthase